MKTESSKHLTLGSLFDGIGGFPFCAVLSGIIPIWAAEIDPACVAVTKQRFPNMKHLGDVSKINGTEIPPVDIVTFGSPCQDLSVAGERKGLKHVDNGGDETTRSGLFIDAVRIVYEMREATNGRYPTYIVWENVEGAFNSHSGRDFQTVLEKITKTDIPIPGSGKWAKAGVVRGRGICAAWRLLDAQYWGVPQRRKRIYLVGSFGNDSAAKILFKPDSVQRYLTACGTQEKRIATDTQSSFGKYSDIILNDQGEQSISVAKDISPTLRAETHNHLPIVVQPVCYDARGNGDGDICSTITGGHNSCITDYSAVAVYSLQGSMIGREDKNGPPAVAYQIQTFIKWIIRRLTPLECERLQGYPDYWTVLKKVEDMSNEDYSFFKGVFSLDKRLRGKSVKEPTKKQIIKWYNNLDNDGARYRMLGNSLAIPCALRVVGYIADYMRRN